jgi:hypothetical protein
MLFLTVYSKDNQRIYGNEVNRADFAQNPIVHIAYHVDMFFASLAFNTKENQPSDEVLLAQIKRCWLKSLPLITVGFQWEISLYLELVDMICHLNFSENQTPLEKKTMMIDQGIKKPWNRIFELCKCADGVKFTFVEIDDFAMFRFHALRFPEPETLLGDACRQQSTFEKVDWLYQHVVKSEHYCDMPLDGPKQALYEAACRKDIAMIKDSQLSLNAYRFMKLGLPPDWLTNDEEQNNKIFVKANCMFYFFSFISYQDFEREIKDPKETHDTFRSYFLLENYIEKCFKVYDRAIQQEKLAAFYQQYPEEKENTHISEKFLQFLAANPFVPAGNQAEAPSLGDHPAPCANFTP